jgi:hypothetical protein
MDNLTAVLFWLLVAFVIWALLALYLGWWPFGGLSAF